MTEQSSRFTIQRVSDQWRLLVGNCEIRASGVKRRAGIQAVLTAHVDTKIIHRDRVTLSSSRSRKRFLKVLEQQKLLLPEDGLIALEDAILRPSPPPQKSKPPSPEISERAVTLSELEDDIRKHLLIDDPDLIAVVLGAAAARRLTGDQPWLVIVGPSGSAKTEVLTLLLDLPETYFLSDLTENTLASGFGDEGEDDPSLLARLTDDILVVKDFTTVLSMHPDKRQAVLAQLREVYDGIFSKAWGTGKHLDWHGRLGFMAAVTAAIDKHHSVMAVLGPRFLLFRMRQPDRQAAGRRALQNSSKEARRLNLRKAVTHFFEQLPSLDPTPGDDQHAMLVAAADLVTRARTVVERDGKTREVLYPPQAEMPTRLPRALMTLARGIALLRQHPQVHEEDIRPAFRVAADCIPPFERELLELVAAARAPVLTAELLGQTKLGETKVRRTLENLDLLGVLERRSTLMGDEWYVTSSFRDVASALLDGSTAGSSQGRHATPAPESNATRPPPLLTRRGFLTLQALADSSGTLADWRDKASLTPRTAKRVAAALVKRGSVRRVRRGHYEITTEGRAALKAASAAEAYDGLRPAPQKASGMGRGPTGPPQQHNGRVRQSDSRERQGSQEDPPRAAPNR